MVAGRENTSAILIVDDDVPTRESVVRWFHTARWRVTSAGGCAQAIEAAVVSAPTHAIVEQLLPDGSGLELLRRLRAIHPGISGVVLTRYPSVAAAVHAMRLGFRDYLPKPVDWRYLAGLFDLEVT